MKVHIVYRAIGDSDVSVFRFATNNNGLQIEERLEKPIYVPRKPFEGVGLVYSTASNPQVTYFSAEDDEEEEGDYVSGEKGDEKPSGDNLEKRPTSNSRNMSEMWDKDVSDNESLKMLSIVTLHDFLE